jgi:hypothetical protein
MSLAEAAKADDLKGKDAFDSLPIMQVVFRMLASYLIGHHLRETLDQ